MQVRSCWAVLTKKAKDTEELLQRSYVDAQKKLRALLNCPNITQLTNIRVVAVTEPLQHQIQVPYDI